MSLSVEAQARYAYVEQLISQDFPPPARVVELGSAPGDQIAQLAARGYECTSLDIGEASDGWGSGEAGRMKRLLADASVTDLTWNLEKTPYPLPDQSFDAVVMTEVYEHLREYPVTSLREVHRVLRVGGRVYFTTPNQAYLVNRLRLLAGRNVQTPLVDWIGGLPFARHAREYTFAEVRTLMEHAGLSVIRMGSRHFQVDSGRGGRAARLAKQGLDRMSRRWPSLGPEIVVVAERATAD